MRTLCEEPIKGIPDCPEAEVKAEQFRLAQAQAPSSPPYVAVKSAYRLLTSILLPF